MNIEACTNRKYNVPSSNAFQTTYAGGGTINTFTMDGRDNSTQFDLWSIGDCFVTKISSEKKNIEWSTYLGGSAADTAYDIALDNETNVFIMSYCSLSQSPHL